MKKLNLSKFYTLNWLAWCSLLANIVFIFYAIWQFIHPKSSFAFLYWLIDNVMYYVYFYIVVFLILIAFVIELILRKTKRLFSYNQLYLPKVVYSCLFWLAVILIPITIYFCYLAFRLAEFLIGD